MSQATSDLQISVGSVTDVGGRENNEDAILVLELDAASASSMPSMLLAVADGMGGHEHGEVASRIAIETLRAAFADGLPDDAALALKQAYRKANTAIFAEGGQNDSGRGMGTTLVAAVVRGKYVTIANVGDSRAYLMRAHQMTQVTQDHSLVEEQILAGQLAPEDARRSRNRNILTQTLGTREPLDRRMPSIFELALLPEDRLLLCTDGFYDVLTNDDYLQLMATNDAADSAQSLTALANERGTTDNVSAIVLTVGESRATIQRQEIAREIEAQRGEHAGSSVLLPAIVLIVVIALIAVGVFVYMR